MDKIVMVLHANDRRDGLRLRDLRDRGIAEPQMRDQDFLPQTGVRRELLLQLLLTCWRVDIAHQPQIDYIEPEIGRAHVCTPVTNAHLVSRLLREKHTTTINHTQYSY